MAVRSSGFCREWEAAFSHCAWECPYQVCRMSSEQAGVIDSHNRAQKTIPAQRGSAGKGGPQEQRVPLGTTHLPPLKGLPNIQKDSRTQHSRAGLQIVPLFELGITEPLFFHDTKNPRACLELAEGLAQMMGEHNAPGALPDA